MPCSRRSKSSWIYRCSSRINIVTAFWDIAQAGSDDVGRQADRSRKLRATSTVSNKNARSRRALGLSLTPAFTRRNALSINVMSPPGNFRAWAYLKLQTSIYHESSTNNQSITESQTWLKAQVESTERRMSGWSSPPPRR
jgi:hypothetical protein